MKAISWPMGLVYGPVESKRFGLSLGVNFLGTETKICSFNCPYCELGLTTIKMSQLKKEISFPTIQSIEEAVRNALVDSNSRNQQIESLLISGHGEPTLHPEFSEAIDLILRARTELSPKVKIVCLTNGANLDNARVIKGLNSIDIPCVKFDAGNEDIFSKMNEPLVRTNIAKCIQGAKKIKNLHVQSFFVQGSLDNTLKNAIDDWMEVVGIVKPQMVYLTTLDRVPPTSGLKQVLPQVLKEISERLTKKTGIKSHAYL